MGYSRVAPGMLLASEKNAPRLDGSDNLDPHLDAPGMLVTSENAPRLDESDFSRETFARA